MELLAESVATFVAESLAVPVGRLRAETRLEEDLGVTGDDAAGFLKAFSERFGVEMSEMDLRRHFGPEGCNPLGWFLPSDLHRGHGQCPVTLAHLVRVAELRRWFSPPRAGR